MTKEEFIAALPPDGNWTIEQSAGRTVATDSTGVHPQQILEQGKSSGRTKTGLMPARGGNG